MVLTELSDIQQALVVVGVSDVRKSTLHTTSSMHFKTFSRGHIHTITLDIDITEYDLYSKIQSYSNFHVTQSMMINIKQV